MPRALNPARKTPLETRARWGLPIPVIVKYLGVDWKDHVFMYCFPLIVGSRIRMSTWMRYTYSTTNLHVEGTTTQAAKRLMRRSALTMVRRELGVDPVPPPRQ
jgi:hypothetical protein